MSWIKTASTSALAAGAILLSAGCSSKKDVAIAAKDDTIRRQEQSIAMTEQGRAQAAEQARMNAEQARVAEENSRRAAELNRTLAAQNDAVMQRAQQDLAASNASAQQLAAMQAQLASLKSDVAGLPGKFPTQQPCPPAPIGGGGGGDISRRPDGSIHITVAGSVLFDSGMAELRPSAAETLSRVASTIRANFPNNAIRIEGHTDSTPVVHSRSRFPDNMALSQARAASVYSFMMSRGGISPSRMYTAGYGDRQPLVSPERTATDRAKNRRVEIVILPSNLNVRKEQLARNEGSGKSYRANVVAASINAKKPE